MRGDRWCTQVGLSNWQLDAAKMNRVILHHCPETNRLSLEVTAR
jgi:hypothetical protein